MKENSTISDELPYSSKYMEVYGSKLHYIEHGTGDPILFLHGIPASCYLWRNIIPHLASLGRCIAPDLIGFGKSDKPQIDYSVQDHIKYIEKFIEQLKLKNVTLIMHGIGSLIGLHYSMQHEKNCKGLVFYEAFLHSINSYDISLPFQEQLHLLQEMGQEATGAALVDKMISQQVMRKLTNSQIAHYHAPFTAKGSELPILQYLKELPTGDNKSLIESLTADYSNKLTKSSLPTLLLYSVPGFLTTMTTIIWAKEHLKNIELADLGEELHFAQESCPQVMGETISVWLQGVEQTV